MSARRHWRRVRAQLRARLAVGFALAALLTACGDRDGTEVGAPGPASRGTTTTLEPGARELRLENVRKPVEAKFPDEPWSYAFEVTGAQTSVQGLTSVEGQLRGVAPPGFAYVRVLLRARNVLADRPAPFTSGVTPGVSVARRVGPQETCDDDDRVGNGQFCENYGKAEEDEYFRVGGTWVRSYYSEGRLPPGGFGEIVLEAGPFPEPLEGRDFFVFVVMATQTGRQVIPLAGG